MTEYNLLISIQRPADYLILIKNVILKQFLPAVSNWIREKKREREREREREKSRMAWVHYWALVMPVYSKLHRSFNHKRLNDQPIITSPKQEAGMHEWTESICQRGSPPVPTGPLVSLRLLFIITHYHNLPVACGSSAELQEIW